MPQKRDEVMLDRWEFNGEVTECFEDMIRRSIPGYDRLRHLTYQVGRRFVAPGDTIVDAGCSLGEAFRPFVAEYGSTVTYVGFDASMPMVEAAADIFNGDPTVFIRHGDVRDVVIPEAHLVLSVFTLQFIPVADRLAVMRKIRSSVRDSGAVIVAEKIAPTAESLQAVLGDAYRGFKVAQGYTEAQIDAKAAALSGYLVPLSERDNLALFEEAGFSAETFWADLLFRAWLLLPRQAHILTPPGPWLTWSQGAMFE